MKDIRQIFILSILLILSSCISQFIPQTTEDKELLIVEGLITDKPGANSIKLSKSLPLGQRSTANPVQGYYVAITDDLGGNITLSETVPGTYIAPSFFHGEIGRFYTLHINSNSAYNNLSYESYPMEMKPVPEIDSIYYEKVTIKEYSDGSPSQQGCQIYLDTHDPANQTKFFRWEYSETWEFHIPYAVPNNTCWLSANSDIINIKSTSAFEEARVSKYPLKLVSNLTDRLAVKYSLLVNQYSLSEDEYLYWDKLQNISEQVGGLYDIIPSAVPSNVYCLNDLSEKVLGYFSVSASSVRRVFIEDRFAGVKIPYTDEACIADTAFAGESIPNLNISAWVIISSLIPPYNVYTYTKGCADCTVRGTKIEPLFWKDGK